MVPSWSRDSHWIYYGSNRSGKSDWQIWKIALEGGEPVQVTKNGGMEASESFDRKFIYYTKIDFHDLWRIPVSGGEETLFLQNNERRYWVLATRGIYFIRNEGGVPWIKFIDFANQQVTSITRLDKKLPNNDSRGLALSPDGRSLLCTLVEQDTSDIMLIENFR
jgi:Tol biopolymer transport system component